MSESSYIWRAIEREPGGSGEGASEDTRGGGSTMTWSKCNKNTLFTEVATSDLWPETVHPLVWSVTVWQETDTSPTTIHTDIHTHIHTNRQKKQQSRAWESNQWPPWCRAGRLTSYTTPLSLSLSLSQPSVFFFSIDEASESDFN